MSRSECSWMCCISKGLCQYGTILQGMISRCGCMDGNAHTVNGLGACRGIIKQSVLDMVVTAGGPALLFHYQRQV